MQFVEDIAAAPAIQEKKLTPLQKSINEKVSQVKSLVVKSDQDMASAQKDLLAINMIIKEVHKEFDEGIKKAHEVHKHLTAQRKRHLDPLENAKSIISGKMGEYQFKIEEEQRRRKREARAKAEEEERKRQAQLKKEQEEAQRKRAEHAEVMGDMESAEDILNSKPEVKEQPLMVPETVPEAPKYEGLSFREQWCWELEVKDDFSKIPSYLLKLDEVAINAMVRAQKGRCRIPGIKVFMKKVPVQKV